MKARITSVLSVALTPVETFVLGAILAAAEGVQLHVTMSVHAHDAVAVAILLLGSVVSPLKPTAFLAKLPPHLIAIIQAILGALLLVVQNFGLGSVWLTVVGVVIVIASSLGIGPTPAPVVPTPASGHGTGDQKRPRA